MTCLRNQHPFLSFCMLPRLGDHYFTDAMGVPVSHSYPEVKRAELQFLGFCRSKSSTVASSVSHILTPSQQHGHLITRNVTLIRTKSIRSQSLGFYPSIIAIYYTIYCMYFCILTYTQRTQEEAGKYPLVTQLYLEACFNIVSLSETMTLGTVSNNYFFYQSL